MNSNKVFSIIASLISTLVIDSEVQAANLGAGTGTLSITGSVNVVQTVTNDMGTANVLDDQTFSTFAFIPQVTGSPNTSVRYTATDIEGAFLPFVPANALPFINFAFGESTTGLIIDSTVANPLVTPLTVTLDPAYSIPGNTPVLDGADGTDFIVFNAATLPVFTVDNTNGLTNVSITALGYAKSGNGTDYTAKATFTTQSTLTETQFVNRLRRPGGLNTSFSATIEIEETQDVPESSNVLALLTLGLIPAIKKFVLG